MEQELDIGLYLVRLCAQNQISAPFANVSMDNFSFSLFRLLRLLISVSLNVDAHF